ncbi:MAG: N-6 DNA methylase [Oscillospiraceae bacterium]|nr:N-6 DNA methylase [Oscillospiraceae bacterium]
MKRTDIITTVGREFLISNIENDEFSFQKALKEIGKNTKDYLASNARRHYKDIDLRFADDKATVLIETKQKLLKSNAKYDMEQLQQYVLYEKRLTTNKIVAILASTLTDDIRVWTDDTGIIDDEHESKNERVIRPFSEYINLFFGTKNDKLAIIQSTYALNELLHNYGINEKIRSQFIGTCLLSLKNGLKYEGLTAAQIRGGIEGILTSLLEKDLSKATKLTILKNKVIDSQDVRDLKDKEFQRILTDVKDNILPYINDESKMGQDLLNLFFTTFNKYVGKSDKNQAFTPDHIVHFMCKVVGINRNSIVLDPCCGSGAFLVRAMTEAIADCDTESERINVKKKQIYGIEYEEVAFGLATTNMLIHSDGNTNILQGNCFTEIGYLNAGINVVLMNPPYNAQRKHCNPSYVKGWNENQKEDPSKGLHFVYEIAKKVKKGKLAVLLPMQCAMDTSLAIQEYKKKMLDEHTLDAVFSFPSDMFYPGSTVVACCMVFTLGTRHLNAPVRQTFFGYFKDDGLIKKKHIGRVESSVGSWSIIEKEWLTLYFSRETKMGASVTREVSYNDEWLAEAYMKTDYSTLTAKDFQEAQRKYLGYHISIGNGLDESVLHLLQDILRDKQTCKLTSLNTQAWKEFQYTTIFDIQKGFYNKKPEHNIAGKIPFIGATEKNNGVTEYYSVEDIECASKTGDENNSPLSEKIFPPNAVCVTNNGSVGFAFYQDREFTCSHDVNPLYLLNGEFNVYTGLFVAAVIMKDRYRWDYGRKWRPARMIKSIISLPQNAKGLPDWDYMEQFIKSLPYGDKI